MKLIIATTPFNIFNAIILKQNFFKGDIVDIYITDFSLKNYLIADKLKEAGIFRKVEKIQQYKYDHLYTKNKNAKIKLFAIKLISKINRIFFKKKCYKDVCGFLSMEKYDEIIFDTGNYPQRVVMNYHYKLNRKIKTNLYDVGHETFLIAAMFDIEKKDAEKRHKQFNCKNLEKIYAYQTEFYPKLINDISLVEIGTIDLRTKELLNQVFEYREEYNDIMKNDFIFFDSATDDDKDLEKQYVEIFKSIQYVTNNAFCVKLHPRTENNPYKGLAATYDVSVPMEMLLLNADDIDNKVLVSHASVATFSPKNVFNKEPTVIMFSKFVHCNMMPVEQVELFETLTYKTKISYQNKEKFILPESMDEFLDVIAQKAADNI